MPFLKIYFFPPDIKGNVLHPSLCISSSTTTTTSTIKTVLTEATTETVKVAAGTVPDPDVIPDGAIGNF